MDSDTFQEINDAINARSSWEIKMSSYYDLRFEGIKRTAKPYKHAPDVHYPLVDTVIEKLKPFYAQQLYGDQVLATFVAQDPVPRDQVTLREQYFDYKVKQCSNFERAIMNAIDLMLHYGFCPFKIYWDEGKQDLGFEAVDPMYVIVPKNTDVDNQPDWLVHVKLMSKAQYMADKLYKNKSSEFVASIVGRGSNPSGTTLQKEQSQAQREGLNFTNDNKQVVVWECYTKTAKGWQVDFISPILGEETALRAPFLSTYQHGNVPFVCLRNESTTKGWYSPRGVTEILFTHEMSLNKSWNSKLQFLDFFGHPVYKNDGLAPINSANFEAGPGRILPQGISADRPNSAPLDFQEEMQFVRALAEDRIQIPDLSAGEHLSGKRGSKGEVTATQVNAVVALSNQSNDLRARLFRMQLSDIYNQADALLRQFASDSMSFVAEGQYNQMPPELMDKKYAIHPSGSADSWNKAYRVQDATMTYQMLLGKPNVNQDELLKYLLESKDPRMIKRLYQDSGYGDKLQGEKQAMELGMMEDGYPPVVKPDDNDAIHLQNMAEWVQMKMVKNHPIDGGAAKLVSDHIQQHGQQAAQKQDKAAMQAMKAIGPTTNILQSIMANAGMQTPEAGANAQAGQPSDKRPSMSINYKDAPDSIKRQMEAMEGFQPAVGEPSTDDKKLMVSDKHKAQEQEGQQQQLEHQAYQSAADREAAASMKDGDRQAQAHMKHEDRKAASDMKQQDREATKPQPLNVTVPKLELDHEALAKALKSAAAPVVHVAPPNVHVPAPVVNVPAPVVHVHPQKADSPAQPKKSRKFKSSKDKEGNYTIEEVG